jgi:ubiquinone/menaquinone biosynthesis C-methylase UbiE
MSSPNTDKVFAGSIPKLYDTYLVPLIFEPYAADLVNRLRATTLSLVLEIAAGTGVVTRALASALPESATIVATDLNQAMLDQASVVGTKRAVEWRQADAMQLPFPDATFDAVACQFGVMFFPDKPKAFSEARRVLKPGGIFIFNVWDRIEDNEFAHTVTTALPGPYAPWLSRPPPHRTRSGKRRVHDLTSHRHGGGAQQGKVRARAGDRILSGDTVKERNRKPRCHAARRSDRCRGGSHRPAVRPGRRRRQDPSAYCHH